MFGVAAAAVIVMVADKLCFASTGDRLLFTSTMTEFIRQCFKREEVLCLLTSARPPLSTRILSRILNGNGEKGNVASTLNVCCDNARWLIWCGGGGWGAFRLTANRRGGREEEEMEEWGRGRQRGHGGGSGKMIYNCSHFAFNWRAAD